MAMPGKADIIRALFAAYLANDRQLIADTFTDDFRFTSPYDDDIDSALETATGSRGMNSKGSSSKAMRPS